MASITGVNSNPIHVGPNPNQAEAKLPETDQKALALALQLIASGQINQYTQPQNSLQELTLSLGKYQGEVKNGMPHGKGTLKYSSTHSNYLRYEGEFEDGLPHGQGVLTYSAGGGTFDGHFVKGDPYKGIAKRTTGTTFTGTFKVNKTGGLDIVDGNGTWLTSYGWKSAEYKNGKDTAGICCRLCCTIS